MSFKFKLLTGVAALAIAGSAVADVTLTGDYITLGVSNGGQLINHSTSTGLQYSGSDFLFPGTPFAFYSIGVGGAHDVSGGYGYGNNPFGVTTIDLSGGVGSPYSLSMGGVAYGLSFTQTISFAKTDKTVLVNVSFTNRTSSAISDAVYAVGIDPDQGIATGDGYYTANTTTNSGALAKVTAVANNGLSITMEDVGHSSESFASVSSGWSTNPYDLLTHGNDGNGDYTIALAFNLGTINAGQTVNIAYTYTVSAVPEPETYGMLLAGLGLMGTLIRRRRIRD